LKVIVLAPCTRGIPADDSGNRHIYRAHIRDLVESILLTGVIPERTQRLRVIMQGHTGRDAKRRNPQQVLGPHMQRTGQDADLVLKNMPGTHSRLCQQALVLLWLHLGLQRSGQNRGKK